MTIALDMDHREEAGHEGDSRRTAIRVVGIVAAIALIAAAGVFGLRAYGAALWPSSVAANGPRPATTVERLTRELDTLKASNEQLAATQQEMQQTIAALREAHDALRSQMATRLAGWGTNPDTLKPFEVPRAAAPARPPVAHAPARPAHPPQRVTVDPRVRDSQRAEAVPPALSLQAPGQ